MSEPLLSLLWFGSGDEVPESLFAGHRDAVRLEILAFERFAVEPGEHFLPLDDWAPRRRAALVAWTERLNGTVAGGRGRFLGLARAGDRLFGGALEILAKESSAPPAVLVGRTRIVDERGHVLPVETPWPCRSASDHMAPPGHGTRLTPPSVFWHREVRLASAFEAEDWPALDFGLLCRLSLAAPLRPVDQVCGATAFFSRFVADPVASAEPRVSLRHAARLRVGSRARTSAWWRMRAVERRLLFAAVGRQGRRFGLIRLASSLLSPAAVLRRRLLGPLAAAWSRSLERLVLEPAVSPGRFPDRYDDGWIGPRFEHELPAPMGSERLLILGSRPAASVRSPLTLRVEVGDLPPVTLSVAGAGNFRVSLPVSNDGNASLRVAIDSEPCFVPARTIKGNDQRELAFVLHTLCWES